MVDHGSSGRTDVRPSRGLIAAALLASTLLLTWVLVHNSTISCDVPAVISQPSGHARETFSVPEHDPRASNHRFTDSSSYSTNDKPGTVVHGATGQAILPPEIADCAAKCDSLFQHDGSCRRFVVRRGTRPADCELHFDEVAAASHPEAATFVRRGPYYRAVNLSIVFGVLAGPEVIHTRLFAAYATWLRDVVSVAFLESNTTVRALFSSLLDRIRATPELRGVATRAIFLPEPPAGPRRSFNGAWKNLPILRVLASEFPQVTWFAIVDDDSFIIQHNLNVLLTTYLRRQQFPYYIGATLQSASNVPYVHGGAGIILNRVAVLMMMEHYEACLVECTQWGGDVRLGCCATKAHVPITAAPGFWPHHVVRSLRHDRRQRHSEFPISFHAMRRREWLYELDSAIALATAKASLCAHDSLAHSEVCLNGKGDIAPPAASQPPSAAASSVTAAHPFQLTVPVSWKVLEAHFFRQVSHEADA